MLTLKVGRGLTMMLSPLYKPSSKVGAIRTPNGAIGARSIVTTNGSLASLTFPAISD